MLPEKMPSSITLVRHGKAEINDRLSSILKKQLTHDLKDFDTVSNFDSPLTYEGELQMI